MNKYFVAPEAIGYCVISEEFCPQAGNYYARAIQDNFDSIHEAQRAADELNKQLN